MKKLTFALTLAAIPFLGFAKDKANAPKLPNVTIDQVQFGKQVNEAPFSKSDLKGKVVVVEQWGVNCPPCIASLPELARLAKSGEKKGLVVVGLECQNSSKEAINKVLDNARVKYPVMAGGSHGVPAAGIPNAAVFGADGKLVWHGNPHNEEFKRAVKDALLDAK